MDRTKIRVAIAGAAGRMGRALVEACHAAPEITLVGGLENAGCSLLGQDLGELAGVGRLGVQISSDASTVIAMSDVLIDFTAPAATLNHASLCKVTNTRHVIGTTGIDADGKAAIAAAALECAIVFAPNMSVGVNLCFRLLALAAEVLGADYDVEIVEAHHRHKRDAPSGTALRMGEVVANALGRKLEDCAIYGREGVSDTGRRYRRRSYGAVRGDR
jgi:4-hydroxy-tetrahydrodipicolinate reductase